MGRDMGLPNSISNPEDWSHSGEDGFVRKLQLRGFDFTFHGELEMISLTRVKLELMDEV